MKSAGIFSQIDFPILASMLFLVGFGLMAIYSACHGIGSMTNFYKQLMWFGGSAFLMLIIFLQPPRLFQDWAYWLYGISIFALVVVLILGRKVGGAVSWIDLGFGRFQPSEITKFTTILALARYLSDRTTNIKTLRHFSTAIGIVILPVILILLQPDTGTALVYLTFIIPMIVIAGFDFYIIFIISLPFVFALIGFINLYGLVVLGVISLGILFVMRKESFLLSLGSLSLATMFGIFSSFYGKQFLKPHQLKRIETFLDPMSDPKGAGYNALQAKVAIGSGGLFGKGFLQGTQTQLRYIPAQWTDFIYCVVAEEFGFIGAGLVIVVFAIFILRMVFIINMMKNQFAALVIAGIVSVFLGHILVNIGMAVGMMPIIGVPLPFLSYGGSSLLANIVAVSIVLNLYRNRRNLAFSF